MKPQHLTLMLSALALACAHAQTELPPDRPSGVDVGSCHLAAEFPYTLRAMDPDAADPRLTLKVHVAPDGRVESVAAVDSSVNARVVSWARREARQCKYRAAVKGGVAVASTVTLVLKTSDRPLAAQGKLVCEMPELPRQAALEGLKGRVVLGVQVGPDGQPQRVEVLESSGEAALDTAALQAGRACRPNAALTPGEVLKVRFDFLR